MRNLPILAVLLLSLALSATALDWGLPPDKKGWAFDEVTPSEVRGAARQGFADGWVANYPPLHYRLLHWAGEGVRLASGEGWERLSARDRDTRLRRAGRWLSVVMATLMVWGIYRCARLYAGRLEATLAATVAAGCLPLTYYAKTANVDVPFLFWFVASMFLLGRVIEKERLLDHVLLAIVAVAAVATKDQAIALYAPVPVLLLVAAYRRTDKKLGRPRRLARALVDRRFLAAGITAALSFVLMMNLIQNLEGFRGHLHRLVTVSVRRFDVYEPTLEGHFQMAVQSLEHLAFAMSWPLFLLGVAGALWTLRPTGRRRVPIAYLLCAVGYYVFFVSVIRHNYVRFLMPIALVLAFFAASVLERSCRPRGPRPWVLLGVVALLAFCFARAAALDRLMLHDSRYAAERWLAENTQGAKVGGVGRLQMLPRGLINMPWHRLRRLGVGVMAQREFDYIVLSRGDIWNAREEALAEKLRSDGSGFVLERCFSTERPWPMPSTEGIYTNLDKISPEVCVLRRRDSLALGGARRPRARPAPRGVGPRAVLGDHVNGGIRLAEFDLAAVKVGMRAQRGSSSRVARISSASVEPGCSRRCREASSAASVRRPRASSERARHSLAVAWPGSSARSSS